MGFYGRMFAPRGGLCALSLVASILTANAAGAADLDNVPMLREGPAAPAPWQRYQGWTKAPGTLQHPRRSEAFARRARA